MKHVYVLLELEDQSLFDLTSEVDHDDVAEDRLQAAHGVAAVTVYASSRT